MKELNSRITYKLEGDYQVINIKGRLTYDEIGEYKKDIKSVIVPAGGYVINLKQVETIDSTGIGLLVNTARHFISNRNKMVLMNDDEFIQELFEVSKLHMLFEIYPNLKEAIEALSVPDDEYWSKVTLY